VAVVIDRWTLAEELWSFGEDTLYLAPLDFSDEDMVRLWVLAGEFYFGAQASARSGGEAAALAAVELVEGEPRPLKRSRRRSQAKRPSFAETPQQRWADTHRIEKAMSFPHPWDD
jgi:hypothetical protein